jgi:hypothetical protein
VPGRPTVTLPRLQREGADLIVGLELAGPPVHVNPLTLVRKIAVAK